jgi:hypothetical protein
LMEAADRVLAFVRPDGIKPTLARLRALSVRPRGWRDKISVVWLLDVGSTTESR